MSRRGRMHPVAAAFVAVGLTAMLVVSVLVAVVIGTASLVWFLSTLAGSARSWTLAETAAYVFLSGAGLMAAGFVIDRIVGPVEADRYEI